MKLYLLNLFSGNVSECSDKTKLGLQLNKKDSITGFVLTSNSLESARLLAANFEKKWGDWVNRYNLWASKPNKA